MLAVGIAAVLFALCFLESVWHKRPLEASP